MLNQSIFYSAVVLETQPSLHLSTAGERVVGGWVGAGCVTGCRPWLGAPCCCWLICCWFWFWLNCCWFWLGLNCWLLMGLWFWLNCCWSKLFSLGNWLNCEPCSGNWKKSGTWFPWLPKNWFPNWLGYLSSITCLFTTPALQHKKIPVSKQYFVFEVSKLFQYKLPAKINTLMTFMTFQASSPSFKQELKLY